MAGYSPKPLAGKLGIKPGHRVLIRNAPKGYDRTLGALPAGVTLVKRLAKELDVIQAFVDAPAAVAPEIATLKPCLAKSGMLWMSWAKKASPLFNGVTETMVRAAALEVGLVDVKVCAVDDDWSGLKLVYRLKDR
jgi:hypothetical protein